MYKLSILPLAGFSHAEPRGVAKRYVICMSYVVCISCLCVLVFCLVCVISVLVLSQRKLHILCSAYAF